MFLCKHCGHKFDIDELHKVPSFTIDGWTRYEYEDACPDCGSEDYVDAAMCEACCEWFDPDDLYDGICGACVDEYITPENCMAYAEDDKEAFATFVKTLVRERRFHHVKR